MDVFAIDTEQLLLDCTPFAGGATDLVKCFDQIDRQLLIAVARKAGMPTKVLDTYQRYMDSLVIRNTIGGGVGGTIQPAVWHTARLPTVHAYDCHPPQTMGALHEDHGHRPQTKVYAPIPTA